MIYRSDSIIRSIDFIFTPDNRIFRIIESHKKKNAKSTILYFLICKLIFFVYFIGLIQWRSYKLQGSDKKVDICKIVSKLKLA